MWDFQIGGYQVLHKWLYDRRGTRGQPGRTLTEEEIAHYQRIVVALKETMRLMEEIDEVIEEHGGWPIEQGLLQQNQEQIRDMQAPMRPMKEIPHAEGSCTHS